MYPNAEIWVVDREGTEGMLKVCIAGQLNWQQLACLLFKAKLLLGLNTPAMHLAAACQCPTVASFGRSIVNYWYPWRVP